MWQRFTDPARKIVYYAQVEVEKRGVTDVAAEHLLLGLLRQVTEAKAAWPPAPTDRVDPHDIAASLLRHVDIEGLRTDLDRQIAWLALPIKAENQIELLPSGKQVIDASYKEALRLLSKSITPEFLLLGMFGDGAGKAGALLTQSGLDLVTAREAVASVYQPAQENRTMETNAKERNLTIWSRLFSKRIVDAPSEKETR